MSATPPNFSAEPTTTSGTGNTHHNSGAASQPVVLAPSAAQTSAGLSTDAFPSSSSSSPRTAAPAANSPLASALAAALNTENTANYFAAEGAGRSSSTMHSNSALAISSATTAVIKVREDVPAAKPNDKGLSTDSPQREGSLSTGSSPAVLVEVPGSTPPNVSPLPSGRGEPLASPSAAAAESSAQRRGSVGFIPPAPGGPGGPSPAPAKTIVIHPRPSVPAAHPTAAAATTAVAASSTGASGSSGKQRLSAPEGWVAVDSAGGYHSNPGSHTPSPEGSARNRQIDRKHGEELRSLSTDGTSPTDADSPTGKSTSAALLATDDPNTPPSGNSGTNSPAFFPSTAPKPSRPVPPLAIPAAEGRDSIEYHQKQFEYVLNILNQGLSAAESTVNNLRQQLAENEKKQTDNATIVTTAVAATPSINPSDEKRSAERKTLADERVDLEEKLVMYSATVSQYKRYIEAQKLNSALVNRLMTGPAPSNNSAPHTVPPQPPMEGKENNANADRLLEVERELEATRESLRTATTRHDAALTAALDTQRRTHEATLVATATAAAEAAAKEAANRTRAEMIRRQKEII